MFPNMNGPEFDWKTSSRRAVLFLGAAALLVVACEGGEDFESEPRGACTLPTNGGEGPTYCKDDYVAATGCIIFSEGASCTTLGYDFCCLNEGREWKFSSRGAAEAHDEIYSQACASEPIECGDEDLSASSSSSGTPGQDKECTSNSSCGSRKKCKSGRCVSVECTSDSHCGGCARCSDNVCRSCGSGPYGCYC